MVTVRIVVCLKRSQGIIEHIIQRLEKAVYDIKGVVEKKGVQSLFQIGEATLFDNTVSGLNDFELISFLVVM